MLTLELDIPITRRMTLCTIRNDQNDLRFTSKHVSSCLQWLYDNGQREFWMVFQDSEGMVQSFHMKIDTALIEDAVKI